jgi:hypothetical protein
MNTAGWVPMYGGKLPTEHALISIAEMEYPLKWVVCVCEHLMTGFCLYVQMYQHLDDFVIGQERAKKVLSVAMYNHYKRLNTCLPSAQHEGENGGYVEHITVQPPIGIRKLDSGSLCGVGGPRL